MLILTIFPSVLIAFMEESFGEPYFAIPADVLSIQYLQKSLPFISW